MKFKVFRTTTFEKEFGKLPKIEQERIDRLEKNLSENPFVGKPLGFTFIREKRLNGRRIYYLVYEQFVVILMVAISTKKTQQATIDAVKYKLEEYNDMVKETLKKL
jgi:putative component of toxin-antitoxin plasmid stabilization module